MEVILDTNFLVTCVKQKIHLFENLSELGFNSVLVPLEVINELEKLKENGKIKERKNAETALILIKRHNPKIISLGSKNVDDGILKYTINNTGLNIATLDRELKTRIKKKNPSVNFITIRLKKKIALQ